MCVCAIARLMLNATLIIRLHLRHDRVPGMECGGLACVEPVSVWKGKRLLPTIPHQTHAHTHHLPSRVRSRNAASFKHLFQSLISPLETAGGWWVRWAESRTVSAARGGLYWRWCAAVLFLLLVQQQQQQRQQRTATGHYRWF